MQCFPQDGESQFAEFPWMAIILEEEEIDYDVTIQRYVCGGLSNSSAGHHDCSSLCYRVSGWMTNVIMKTTKR